ncbi:MAG: hypothetical protein WAO61_06440 [Solirubrobacterales bacterium]
MAADRPPDSLLERLRRFNPFTSETDMFRVLLGVVVLCALLVSIALAARAVF